MFWGGESVRHSLNTTNSLSTHSESLTRAWAGGSDTEHMLGSNMTGVSPLATLTVSPYPDFWSISVACWMVLTKVLMSEGRAGPHENDPGSGSARCAAHPGVVPGGWRPALGRRRAAAPIPLEERRRWPANRIGTPHHAAG